MLKDATASALYGSRGANGIIVITTKSGKKENLKLISTLAGFSGRAVKDYKQVNTDQYFQLYWEALRNGYVSPKISQSQLHKWQQTILFPV